MHLAGGGQVGFGWTPPDGFNDPEWAQRSEDLLDRSIAEMFGAMDGNPGNTVLLGFSQGGGLAYRYGLVRPDFFAGIVALSTGFPRTDGFDQTLPLQRLQPIFVGHGTQDPVVPVESGRTAKTRLVELGYAPEHHEYPMGHEISDEEIRDLARANRGYGLDRIICEIYNMTPGRARMSVRFVDALKILQYHRDVTGEDLYDWVARHYSFLPRKQPDRYEYLVKTPERASGNAKAGAANRQVVSTPARARL